MDIDRYGCGGCLHPAESWKTRTDVARRRGKQFEARPEPSTIEDIWRSLDTSEVLCAIFMGCFVSNIVTRVPLRARWSFWRGAQSNYTFRSGVKVSCAGQTFFFSLMYVVPLLNVASARRIAVKFLECLVRMARNLPADRYRECRH